MHRTQSGTDGRTVRLLCASKKFPWGHKKGGKNGKLFPCHGMFLFWKGASPNDTTSVTRETIDDCIYFLTGILLCRAFTRILKTGVQDSHLAKSRSPNGKSGSSTPKNWSPTNACIPYIFPILAGSDTFE